MKRTLFCAALTALIAVPFTSHAQEGTGLPVDPKFKYSTPIAPGVAVPDTIESSIGTLKLSHGYPDDATVEKIYDTPDRSRALQAYLLAIPIVSQVAMRDSLRQRGPDNQTNVIWEDLVGAKTVELTANDNTVYSFIWLDTHKGPLVVEIPPKVLGTIDDFWYSWVVDVGITGPDKGEGGKYLVLPPGYKAMYRQAVTSRGPALTETGWSSVAFSSMAQPSPGSSHSRSISKSILRRMPPIRPR